MSKIMSDSKCSLDIAIPWAICAKNALCNIYGFAPNQLVFGRNISLPSVHSDKLPAQNVSGTSALISCHLLALHKARQSFIAQESCEKLRRALQTRNFSNTIYQNGDQVYKRKNNTEWHGPAKVLGKDSAQYLLKHGGTYVRVHPCKMQLVDPSSELRNVQHSDKANVSSTQCRDVGTQCEQRIQNQHDMDSDIEIITGTVPVVPLSPLPTPAHQLHVEHPPEMIPPVRMTMEEIIDQNDQYGDHQEYGENQDREEEDIGNQEDEIRQEDDEIRLEDDEIRQEDDEIRQEDDEIRQEDDEIRQEDDEIRQEEGEIRLEDSRDIQDTHDDFITSKPRTLAVSCLADFNKPGRKEISGREDLNVWDKDILSMDPEDTSNESEAATPVETSGGIFQEEQGSTLVVSPKDLPQVKSKFSTDWMILMTGNVHTS